jgi:hypothetical protein
MTIERDGIWLRKVTNRRRRASERIAGQENLNFVAVADQKKFWSHSPTFTVLCLHRPQANETVEVREGPNYLIASADVTAYCKDWAESRPFTAFVFIERREAHLPSESNTYCTARAVCTW